MSGNRRKNLFATIKIKIPDRTSNQRDRSGLKDYADITRNDGSKEVIKFQDLKDVGLLGEGKFGSVRKMVHVPSKLEFAVKVINGFPHSETGDNRDIEISTRLGEGCQNLIHFYGALFAQDCYWMLTEVMDTSLELFYTKAFELKLRLPEEFYALISISVLSALCYMKELRLMHRDIKPSNILLNSNGEMKLCDYGISGYLDSESLCVSFKGFLPYMSPEKINVKAGYSIKSDVWSLGISLIEIATGKHPFSDICNESFILSTRILDSEAPKLDRNSFSEIFCDFVDVCLIKKERDRPQLDILMQHPFISEIRNIDRDIKHKLQAIIYFVCKQIK